MIHQNATGLSDRLIDVPIDEAAGPLLSEIRHTLAKADPECPVEQEAPCLLRAVIGISSIDPLLWLHAQNSTERLYWSSRDDDYVTAGIGALDILDARDSTDYGALVRHVSQALKYASDDLRYFGGIRFTTAPRHEACWLAFGAWRFVLPRFELYRRGGLTFLACNLDRTRDASRSDEEWLADIEQIARYESNPDRVLPAPLQRLDNPNRDGWNANVLRALESFRNREYEKIVLARCSTFTFEQHLNPFALLYRLRAATPDCFHFCFMPDHTTAFIGASPERLYRRDGRSILSEAVAGTRPRTGDTESDARLARDLLNSDKDRREHLYVREAIRNDLEAICDELECDAEPSLLRLARGQHLFSAFKGRLKQETGDNDLLTRLHPTPALGGYPTQPALKAIGELEPFERGWYGSPVGWIGREGAEFAVAIRSGLVYPYSLSVFSGAGLVEGSTPDDEWNEIEHKIADFIKVLITP